MEKLRVPAVTPWLIWISTGTAYLVCALVALKLTQGTHNLALFWPASGVAVAAMVLTATKWWPGVALSVGIASFTVNVLDAAPVARAIGFTIANVVECLTVAWFLRRARCYPPSFDNRVCLRAMVLGTLVSATASATIATASAAASQATLSFFISWFCTVFLGVLIVTPMIVESVRPFAFREVRRPKSSLFAGVVVVAFAAATALAAFGQTAFPMLFLTLATVILASFVAGVGGAVASVFVIALTGSVFSSLNLGPIHLIGTTLQSQVSYFQFYLLTLLACGLPTATLLAEVRRTATRLEEQNRLLALAEQTAQMGHWRFEIGASDVFWSRQVFRIHGLEPNAEAVPLEQALGAYHPEDRAALTKAIARSLKEHISFSCSARLRRSDGVIRRVESHGKLEMNGDEPVAMFGTIIDVTEKADALDQLEAARQAAVRQAEQALHLAETDQLTGIANRRKLLDRLDECASEADALMLPVSFVMFDVDNFKTINDTYGHSEGDAVLQRIAGIASACLRKGDLVGRLGGEEFGVILPRTDLATASRIAERIRAAIEADGANAEGSRRHLSVSLGVAERKPSGLTADLIAAADLALYEAKASGKNCLRLAA